ncbi:MULTISPECIES: erythromycin esterase family protein [Streptomyces]|uniref:Erythromycin esterase family protein n=1 Tax=Streptomyces griseocarneus TaxID=51201 RepID=A0ABX7RL21_9ACTN|nr:MULTISPECIES: erythromycin esterase family protein [Streptomyces]QSY48945.1 erythromycin esterase family protein [Streptomyces griseocarneus]
MENTSTAVQAPFRSSVAPSDPRHADARPLSDAALDTIAQKISETALVAGIGESTRFSRETFGVQDRLLHRLVHHHGFRALAIQDTVAAGDALDRYVRSGDGSAASALDGAWRPWRTVEMATTLEWIRAFNRDHPNDPVRILGVKPAQTRLEDYDAVLDHVRRSAPELAEELASHLDPIRTAHHTDEHVQRHQGTHPGRPFAEHARDALALVRSLPGLAHDDDVLTRMRGIADYHERSVAGRGDYAGDAAAWAGAIGDHQRRTGTRVVYWDGIVHTSATATTLGMATENGPRPSTGGLLREAYGDAYVSVAIGFHHGDLGVTVVPEPGADLIDATLGQVDLPAHWLDLRHDDVRRRWDGPAKLRVIGGVYDPSRDATAYTAVASLADAFDVLIHFREASAVRWLP